MFNRILILGAVALSAGACAVEHRAVVSSEDACGRYGFTASTRDYQRCQNELARQRQAGRVAMGYSEARLTADAQMACDSYGVPRGSAQFDRCVQDEFVARRPS